MTTPDVHTITVPGGTLRVTTEFTSNTTPTPPAPVPAVDRLYGVHTTDKPAAVKARYPGVTVTRPFISEPGTPDGVIRTVGSLTGRVEKACRASWDAGMTPVYSFKLDPVQVFAGKWDGPAADLAAWHRDQPAAKVILWHEPENDFTGAEYARYFNRLAAAMRGQNPNLPLLYSAMGYQWAPGSKGAASVKGRTDDVADWRAVTADLFCCNVYSGRSFPLSATLPAHVGFKRWLNLVVDHAARYGITERGFTTTPLAESASSVAVRNESRAAAIRREKTWLDTDPAGRRCALYVYWSTGGVEGDLGLIVGDQPGQGAVRDLVT